MVRCYKMTKRKKVKSGSSIRGKVNMNKNVLKNKSSYEKSEKKENTARNSNVMEWKEMESDNDGTVEQCETVSETRETRSNEDRQVSKILKNKTDDKENGIKKTETVKTNGDNRLDRVDRLAKMIRIKAVLRYLEEGEIVEEQTEKEKENRFKRTHKGKIIVIVSLNSRNRTIDKDRNVMKITNYLMKNGIKLDSIKSSGFGKAEITFIDIVHANRCLDLNNKEGELLVKFVIPNRIKKCKGIIKDWDSDMPLDELVSAIDNSKNIIQMERMKERQFSAKDRRVVTSYSHLVMVTMEGGNIPQYFSMYGGVTRISVRPFVEPVIQCFSCLRFGHTQDKCGRYKTCHTCGKAFHGECSEKACCINCGGCHSSKDKNCIVYQENCEIKNIMADRNISAFEARREILKRKPDYYEEDCIVDTTACEEGTNVKWEEVGPKLLRRTTYAEKVQIKKNVRSESKRYDPKERRERSNSGAS